MGNAREKLAAELERQPTTEELAKQTAMTEEEVEKLLKVSGDDLSLSSAVGEDGSLELGDTLEQDTVPSVELQLMKSSFEEQIHNLVAELDEKEREVLRMRFGLDGKSRRRCRRSGRPWASVASASARSRARPRRSCAAAATPRGCAAT